VACKMLAEELGKSYPTVRGFINAQMIIALVRATNRCTRGFRIPASGTGVGLLNIDNYLETLNEKQYLKIRAEFPLPSV